MSQSQAESPFSIGQRVSAMTLGHSNKAVVGVVREIVSTTRGRWVEVVGRSEGETKDRIIRTRESSCVAI